MGTGINRALDYSDYAALPDDGKRYEIIRGALHVTPAPSPVHQRVSFRLQRQLADYFEGRSLGETFNAPLDLILTTHDIVQPDLLVVGDPQQISGRGVEGPPLLVVEILSPSTRRRDRWLKAKRYAELGIAHYWLVDPKAKRVECHGLTEGSYRVVAESVGDGTLAHSDIDGLVIDLTALWR